MKDYLNDRFPPLNPNPSGPTHRAKKTKIATNYRANQKRKQFFQVGTASYREEQSSRSAAGQTKPSFKLGEQKLIKQVELIKAWVASYIAEYPLQTIGGLLTVLAVIVLLKAVYHNKNWKAKRMAEEAFYVANQYARNNSTNLHPYLSQAFRREVRQFPGLLPISMQTATLGGSIAGAESVGLQEITPDSVIVEMKIRYGTGSRATIREEKRYQPLVYEKDQWRLGLAYNK